MKVNSYIIAKDDKVKKPFLARVSVVNDDGSVEAVLEKDVQFKQQTVTVKKKHIKVNLGMTPLPGTAYGCDLNNLYRKTINHEFWGSIHFFVDLEDNVRKMLKKSLSRTGTIVEKLKLTPYATVYETEIRAKKGKWAGMFVPTREEDKPHRVWYAPSVATDPAFMDYVVLHEMGHAIRHVGVRNAKLRNKWQRLYQRSIAPVQVGPKVLQRMLTDIGEYDELEHGFKHVFRTVSDDVGPRVGKAVLQWMKETHRITPRELDVMWNASKTKDIAKYWPEHEVDTHELKPVLTEYATKNVEETFAETFAYYALGKKIPEKFSELMEESLSVARAEMKE